MTSSGLYPKLQSSVGGESNYHPIQDKETEDDNEETVLKFENPKYRDVLWAILFLVHLAAFVLFAIKGWKDGRVDFSDYLPYDDDVLLFVYIILGTALCGLVVGMFYVFLLDKCAKFFIYLSMVSCLFALIFLGILVIYLSNDWYGYLVGGILFLCSVFYLLVMLAWRKKLNFCAVMLDEVAGVTRKFRTAVLSSIIFALVFFGYSVFWCLTLVFCINATEDNSSIWWVTLYLLFSYFWTSQVLSNCLHVSMSYLFAVYFCRYNTDDFPSSPVWQGTRRAFTYHFGSVCFASLFVAIIQTLKALVQRLKEQSKYLACCLGCCLSCLEALVKYLNEWALTEVAISCQSYCGAARSTFTLFRQLGLDVVVNDHIVNSVLWVGVVLVTAVCFGVAFVLAEVFNTDTEGSIEGSVAGFTWLAALVGGFVGGNVMWVIVGVIDSGTTATFVCLAEEPEAMKTAHPALMHELKQTYDWEFNSS
eukprot:Lithocolla_globosa_v1_NODE_3806_length_1574_cov_118.672153.p1 type:complete len:477 gc:universal NODE_3806_length_1574_cov_118.672153:55-1485(+)